MMQDNRRNYFSYTVVKTSTILAAALVFIMGATALNAQTMFMQLRGQITSPAYEGWWPNDDGSFKLFFGYMNTNWEQQFDISIGSENYFSTVDAGELDDLSVDGYDFSVADRGQPTHFYPRRNPFLFTIDVPADFGDEELVWTLKTEGQVNRAYGTLKADYRIDAQVISTEVGGNFGSLSDSLRTNIPPDLRVEGESFRTARVGQPLSLAVVASDLDNLPARRDAPMGRNGRIYRPPSSIVAMSGPGLRFSWTIYRGPAKFATFNPAQFKTYTDTRMYANSPWAPPFEIPMPPENGRWTAEVTFTQPGEYVLRGIASDGSLFTYRNINVTVSR
ncbi:MAG: hypothetical protein COA96_02360 [SAR86 cluster bacterium]|uniref:Uncharacterized protein n=1 Tax=SAR86 cluster bacterium TaxID=2030880 RepID=A0A2A5B992_9GAMM|nr:MAG: hypothetical protein COA96_02360 [SAR86 cluster bacterium]